MRYTLPDQEIAYAVQPIKVDVSAVEGELAKQWRAAIEKEDIGPATTRVILSNLLVYSSNDKDADDAMAVISDVIAGHPSRAIVVDDEPAPPEQARQADVSMICSIGERGRRLCGEVVRIHAHGSPESMFGSIMPVMIADLPTFLWNPSDLVWDRSLIRRLLQISDQWVVDSRKFASWSARFEFVESFALQAQAPIIVHDLAWVSIISWREAIARMYDPISARDYLLGVKGIEIECASQADGKPHVTSLLLAAWLMQRLELGFDRVEAKDGEWTVTASSDHGPVMIRLKTNAQAKSSLTNVTIESELDGKHGIFRAALSDHTDNVSIEVNAPDAAVVPYATRMASASLRDDVTQVMNGLASDVLYRQALPIIRKMAAGIEGQKV